MTTPTASGEGCPIQRSAWKPGQGQQRNTNGTDHDKAACHQQRHIQQGEIGSHQIRPALTPTTPDPPSLHQQQSRSSEWL
ncbi:MAG: hypothetical protein CM15mP77_3090 [Synechococcus sp.]|nr:MAG: hypothetical protein CM15mP77_3090 [Synechococcus sp.]